MAVEQTRYLQRRMPGTNAPFPPSLHAILMCTILAGCAGPRSTVGEGFLQKRQLQPGWHLDLGGRAENRPVSREATQRRVALCQNHYPRGSTDLAIRLERGSPASLLSRPIITGPSGTLVDPSPVAVFSTLEQRADTTPARTPSEEQPEGRTWNPWALPAFAAALATITYGIWGTSNLILIGAVVLTLVLAIIALKKGRMNEWSGKGFAITAMILGSLAALITLIALLSGGA